MKQCNLCGLREDTAELIAMNKTWCLVYGKEVDNKFPNSEHWHPGGFSVSQKFQIADEIMKNIEKGEYVEKGKYMETSLTSNKIWIQIQNDFDISKRSFGKKINFVMDAFKRKAIFRDIEQAYTLANQDFSKPALILAGGVIEELLRFYLSKQGKKPITDTFGAYIQTCQRNNS